MYCIVEDVVYFLASRHGISADLNFVKERLMPDLAGALEEDEEEPVFDMVELVSVILIPHFLKDGNQDLFRQVMDMILLDITSGEVDNSPTYLNGVFVKKLLEFYGETNVPQKAIDDMLHAAGAREGVDGELRIEFTPEVLQRATTFDLKKYNTDWDHSATTHFDDAFYGTSLHFATPGNTLEEANDVCLSETDDAKCLPEKSKPKMTVHFVLCSREHVFLTFSASHEVSLLCLFSFSASLHFHRLITLPRTFDPSILLSFYGSLLCWLISRILPKLILYWAISNATGLILLLDAESPMPLLLGCPFFCNFLSSGLAFCF